MNRCPITYELCGDQKYSQKGLRLLSRKLVSLNDFPYTPKEQVHLATLQAGKLSIQGVQPKLSVKLNVSKQVFEIVEKKGRFILKPPHHVYEEIPQNEDLTMRLAKAVGIETPLHGMIYNKDNSLSYFIQRFDRLPNDLKIAVEDFAQLLQFSRETKYDSSMEQVVSVLDKHCTFPKIEKLKLFRIILFNFFVGNEDMHLKNFMLIRRHNKVELSPAYDLVNTTIALKSKEEIALPLRGKKSKLKRSDLIEYFAIERLGLNEEIVAKELTQFEKALSLWNALIEQSFLSFESKKVYQELVQNRFEKIRH